MIYCIVSGHVLSCHRQAQSYQCTYTDVLQECTVQQVLYSVQCTVNEMRSMNGIVSGVSMKVIDVDDRYTIMDFLDDNFLSIGIWNLVVNKTHAVHTVYDRFLKSEMEQTLQDSSIEFQKCILKKKNLNFASVPILGIIKLFTGSDHLFTPMFGRCLINLCSAVLVYLPTICISTVFPKSPHNP